MVGPNDNVIIPRGSQKTDWEVELGVVIGKGGRYIDERDAMQHVAGYCVINDVSEREYQIERGGTGIKAKAATRSGRPAPGWSPPMKSPIPTRLTCGWRSTASAIRTATPAP